MTRPKIHRFILAFGAIIAALGLSACSTDSGSPSQEEPLPKGTVERTRLEGPGNNYEYRITLSDGTEMVCVGISRQGLDCPDSVLANATEKPSPAATEPAE